jgi:hypothetical protein
VAKDFVTYKVHIHKAKHEELYRLLEDMPKSTRGIFIREAIEHHSRINGMLNEKPKAPGMEDIPLEGAFDRDFGGPV